MVITNLSGLDPVNESRTYTIYCRPMTLDVAMSGRVKDHNRKRCDELRQELDAWGMAQAWVARELYEKRMAIGAPAAGVGRGSHPRRVTRPG
jgi:hypothetical protein